MSKSSNEETKESANEKKHPIGKVIPGSPFIIVALSYLSVLVLSLLLIGMLIYFIR